MIKITFLDGNTKLFETGITPLEIAKSISLSLEKQAAFAVVDGIEWDLDRPIVNDSKLQIVTFKDKEVVINVMRHDLAHIMAESVLELFPNENIRLATGPVVENGFFYDFYSDYNFSVDDLDKISKRMIEIIDRKEKITREDWSKEKAIEYFSEKEDFLKLEVLKTIKDETVSIYKQGNFLDLCKGPHLSDTSKSPKFFWLNKVSGSYFQGNKDSYSLQRISAVAFYSKEDLELYKKNLEEAEKRDHRKIGKDLDLFHLQEEATGAVFWHPKGWRLFRKIEEYMRKRQEENDYIEVKTPQILSRSLWEKSGHWEKFSDDIFVIEPKREGETQLAVKPMNCPCHIEIFKQGIKSYRDLPIRMAEFGSCHRNEPSGSLHGIMRVRAFTQDDAHIFCTIDQVFDEVKKFTKFLRTVYLELLGETSLFVRFSDRPEKRAGSDETWDKAESLLYKAATEAGLEVTINKGEGAFYGPKLEFVLKDSIGRSWQVGTLQMDFVLPERLGATYIGEDGNKHIPVMMHRAILGSFERFIGILIEHYSGKFPFWLAPTQIVIATIVSTADGFAKSVFEKLKESGFDVELDLRNEKINYKIREHSLKKIPFIIAIGNKEVETSTLTIRELGKDEQIVLNLDEAVKYFLDKAKKI